jgi:hypothetical protein
MFGVIGRIWQRRYDGRVVRGNGVGKQRAGNHSKEHVADSVALSVRPYARSMAKDRVQVK